MESPNILLARQPIYDKHLNVFGYELLFRSTLKETDADWDGDIATSQLIVNAFTEIGIERVTDRKRAFINFTRRWLLSPPPFDARHVIIEVLESVEPDAEVTAALRKMAQAGFTIALDDFEFSPEWVPILELAHIVKIDVLQHNETELRQLLKRLEPFELTLLAEKVEDYECFELCKSLNFDYFQGFFLCHPQNIHGGALPPAKMVVMRLLAEIQAPESSMERLDTIISGDVSLSAKLLRLCNTAHYNPGNKISVLRQALVRIGLIDLRLWTSLIALAKLDDKPNDLITLALVRGRTMRGLADFARLADSELYFTMGMFSLIDAFFDQPKSKILASLPLDDRINQALLDYQNEGGLLLRSIELHEKGQWDSIDWPELSALNICPDRFEEIYTEALVWTDEIVASLQE